MDLVHVAPQPECRLLSLPPELRNHIWQLVLVQITRTIRTRPVSYFFPTEPGHSQRRQRFCANILRTCKQINAEGTPILYGENIFRAHPSLLTAMPRFIISTFPDNVQLPAPVTHPRVVKLIRRYCVHVRLDIDPRFTRAQAKDCFTGVEELDIDVFQAMYGGSDFSVLSALEDVRGVGKVSIQGSMGDGRYRDWLTSLLQQPVGTPSIPYHEEYVGGSASWHAWSQGKR